jgi:hypothetical protein
VEGDMQHPTGDYYPVMYYINLPYATVTNEVIFAIATALNGEDEIGGWYVKSDLTVEEIKLDTSDTNNIIPIIIISNGTDSIVGGPSDSITTEPYDPSRNFSYIADEYQINFRYESSGKSEYRIGMRAESTNGGFYGSVKGPLIKRFAANQINTLFNAEKNVTVYENYGALFASYERDWYASKKTVSVPNWTSYPLGLRMKYNDEFYQRMYVDNGTQTTVTSWSKGKLRIKF